MNNELKDLSQIIELVDNEQGTYPGNLKHYFNVLWNSKGVENPYHNIRHILHVFWHTYHGLIHHDKSIVPDEIRIGLIAAMFHDINHVGKCGKDRNDWVNIKIAKATFLKSCLPEDEWIQDEVIKAIEATEFPHRTDLGELPLYVKILKDVDLASTLHTTWIQQTIFGLSKEMEMTPNEMLKMQIPFLSNMKFETAWARLVYNPQISLRLIEVEKMIKCLNL